jgi:hypothetical protein
MQSGELIASALCEDFNTAVVVVPNPTRDAEQVGLTLYEPAEAYALHASSYYEAAGLDGFFSHHDFVPDG